MMICSQEFDIKKILNEILSNPDQRKSIFDQLIDKFELFSDRPASSIYDIKRRDNKRLKGLGWEKFCQFYRLPICRC